MKYTQNRIKHLIFVIHFKTAHSINNLSALETQR